MISGTLAPRIPTQTSSGYRHSALKKPRQLKAFAPIFTCENAPDITFGGPTNKYCCAKNMKPLGVILLFLGCLVLVTGCDVVTSSNQPHSDADALALAGITMSPAPKVEHVRFQAGMDDHMELVIRFPKRDIVEFWGGSKWSEEDAEAIEDMSPRMQHAARLKVQRIGGDRKVPILGSLRASTAGIWCERSSEPHVGLRVYLALDLDPNDVIAYVEWFQT